MERADPSEEAKRTAAATRPRHRRAGHDEAGDRVTDRVLRPAFTPEGVDASTVWLGIGAVMGLTALRALGRSYPRTPGTEQRS